MSTAGMVVIGDEILTGKVHDKNSHTLAQILFSRGVRLRRIVTVTDDVDDIAESVRAMSARVAHVFTSGGIGPTHDDVTYEGVARAFDRRLVLHDDTWEKLRRHHLKKGGSEAGLNAARQRMAIFPEGAEIVCPVPELWVPVVVVENVHILPGIPGLFETLVEGIKDRFTGPRIHRRLVFTMKPEGDIAAALGEIQRALPHVAIGSYPHPEAQDHKGMVTLESEDEAAVEEATKQVFDAVDGFTLPWPVTTRSERAS